MSNQNHTSDETPDFLVHFGVKGMKWGVRKDRIPTEKTRNTTDMAAFNERSPFQALSTKGVISKEEASKVEKDLDDLIEKEAKAHEARIDKIVDKHSSKIEKFESEFEAKNGNRVLSDKELTSYNKTINKLYDDMDSEIEKALTEKFSPKVTDLMTLYLTSETKKNVYRRRAEIAARGALVGIGGLTVLMSDNTGINIQSPTLAEMEENLSHAVDARVRHSESPSVAEMRDILENDGEALSHFGIKGMKWGVRRSRRELARLRNDDGEDVGGLRASTRKAANKLRSMKPGETIVIDDGEKGPKIYTKQPDGTFKQTHLAADTERFMRTMTKDPSEMSTKEIQDATKRAQAVEAYNKMFNPYGDPNHELKLKAEAMKLEAEYRKAYAQVNPPSPSMAKKLGTFIEDMTPAYNVFKAADKAVNGKFSKSFKDIFNALDTSQANVGNSGNTKKTASYPFTATKSKTSASSVYNITDLGKDDYLNPFIAELEGRR